MLQVDGSDQMRYLHHRMQHCSQDEAVIAKARQLAVQRRTAAAPAMHIRPQQVPCTFPVGPLAWHAAQLLHIYDGQQSFSLHVAPAACSSNKLPPNTTELHMMSYP
jgi:hypothetical protein